MADLRLDIITYLTDEGVVAGDGVDAFRDIAPEAPDDVVAVYEYTGGAPNINEDVAQRSIQITARSASATTARNKALEIYNTFTPAGKRIDLTATRWCVSFPRHTPRRIKSDSNNDFHEG